jgi:hypothetical protein
MMIGMDIGRNDSGDKGNGMIMNTTGRRVLLSPNIVSLPLNWGILY